MEEFFRTRNGQLLLKDIHTIAESLKVISEHLEEDKEEKKDNKSVQK